MKKVFSLLTLFTFLFLSLKYVHIQAQTTCESEVIIHYHRYNDDYDNYEFWTWDTGTNGTKAPVEIVEIDDFGAVGRISVCSDAKDQIGLIPKEKDTWNYKDGIDVNNDGDIDNKMIDVQSIRGTTNSMDVYIMQGSNEIYYQDPLKQNYFGKPGSGNLVVVYYNPAGNEGWDDFWTWSTGKEENNGILFDYNLGIDGGTNPNLFRVAVLNIFAEAEDQIGFIVRKNKNWDIKDNEWAKDLESEVTDDNGHTYSPNGNRLINVSDIKGSGFKFIYVINGNKTIYEDYNQFISEAFKLEFVKAEFRTTKALSIEFNQSIAYEKTGPDISKFKIVDDGGNVIQIDKITYDSLATSGKEFNIVLKNDIEPNKTYIITYAFEQFGEQKQASMQTTIAEGVFDNIPDIKDSTTNYTGYLIAGIIVLVASGATIAFIYRKK